MLVTRDGGKTWTDTSRNLPRAPVKDAVLMGRALYLATDVGVFVKRADKPQWSRPGSELARSPVNDLRYTKKNDTLYAGTFGRGIFAVEPPHRP